MAEVFQRGEDVSWPFLVRDDAGNIIDLAGGTLTLSIWYRGKSRLTLAEGAGLTILDESPAIGDPQPPHGTAILTAVQTAALPAGRIAQVQSKFVDSQGNITLSPLEYLDDVIGSTAHQINFGGAQGPAGSQGATGETGPPGTDASGSLPITATGSDTPRLLADWMAFALPRIKTVSATSYTILVDDIGKVLDFTAATAVAVTIPSGLPANFICGISQGGAGKVTLAAGSGTTLNEADGLFGTEARYVLLSLMAFAANAYRLYGRVG